MSAFYIMDNGKVASVDNGDGTTSLITLDKLKEYCGYQWRAVYEYDCDTETWSEVSAESAWARQSPIECEGTIEEVTLCKYAVYGELYLCEPDPLPEKPSAPTFVPVTCCGCPCVGTWLPASWPCGGLLETYNISVSLLTSSSSGYLYRGISGTVTATTGSVGGVSTCKWVGGPFSFEVSTDDGETWDPTSQDVGLWLDSAGGRWCIGWAPAAFNPYDRIVIKETGLTPIGDYVGPIGATGSGAVS